MRTPDHQNVTCVFSWVSSRSPPEPFKLILLGLLMHYATGTYPPTLQRRGGSLMSPDLTKNKSCLTRNTFVMSHNGRRNNHLQSTEKYYDNVNTSFGGHQLQPQRLQQKPCTLSSQSNSSRFHIWPLAENLVH